LTYRQDQAGYLPRKDRHPVVRASSSDRCMQPCPAIQVELKRRNRYHQRSKMSQINQFSQIGVFLGNNSETPNLRVW